MPAGEDELIRRFQSGESQVFDDLMTLFEERALALAYYRSRNREDALDIVQEAFIRLYAVLPDWKPQASLFTWLYRVIVNLACDRGRSRARAGEISLEKVPLPADLSRRSHPRNFLEGKEIGERIELAVAALPEGQREVFVLRHSGGMSMKEIAVARDCSVGAVKANLFQALRKLRRELEDLK